MLGQIFSMMFFLGTPLGLLFFVIFMYATAFNKIGYVSMVISGIFFLASIIGVGGMGFVMLFS